ncbi:KpsF/GutQ family sugar-phosphate isomerase [Mesobacterium sp. TK19101]|uniref:KpsF/GutQ family sugar-phosphate isomerase n=1 Tax=Mesobacterium hydrothermale TaxID=3111907 RepID=A0ABU6HKM0_9RHOB|nr:KpsF/GutQ family sugar-phosphate isomerase [Mesobacterium sp. TK19101]MEC3862662.1 KpsF/GutQ family sugar-phosphate isomerase [Mesobacterium sp. TK19101]
MTASSFSAGHKSEAAAQRTLQTEATALQYLAENLPADFVPAIERILGVTGRVIVSGIGKSGHIGRKIAATLASTGTPSYFVHCAEASHGDLGMITPDDICLLLSNSGETSELRDIIYHTKRFSIPMIGISCNPDSTLMKAADYRLTLPKLPEACPIGMAPTTSTTMTLALGDALAVALMEERGFKAEDFGVYHPGGKLGAQMKTVAEMMHTGDALPVLDHTATMRDVLLTMTSKGFGIAVLTRDGVMSGVITDGDLRRNMEQLMDHTPAEIANPTPVTVAPDCLAPAALALANERKVSALLVVDDKQAPVGVLHIHDFLRAGVM